MGGDLGGLWNGPQKVRWGTAHASVPKYLEKYFSRMRGKVQTEFLKRRFAAEFYSDLLLNRDFP